MNAQVIKECFKGYGIELEYSIVDRSTLNIKPIADKVIKAIPGNYGYKVEFPVISWSNEIAAHVIELKTTYPMVAQPNLSESFHKSILYINQILAGYNAKLLPTGAHPWMDPAKETCLFDHYNNELYESYHKVFNCNRHGWSNIQSTHINLPYENEVAFGRLHAAIRLILPLLPAIAASSPILNNKPTGYWDTRLRHYQKAKKTIPFLTGKFIPEPIFTLDSYQKEIINTIEDKTSSYDIFGLFNPTWINSRGAVARIDRDALEIRLLDVQECPAADMAIASLIVGVLTLLINEEFSGYEAQKLWESNELRHILNDTIKYGENAVIENHNYLRIFGIYSKQPMLASDVLFHLLDLLIKYKMNGIEAWKSQLTVILNEGTLSSRILRAINNDYSEENLRKIYNRLSKCLKKNKMFLS